MANSPSVLIGKQRVPLHLAKRFTHLSESGTSKVVESLKRHYFPRHIWGDVRVTSDEWLASAEGRQDLQDHVSRRLEVFRSKVIPWLDDAKPLLGARILEIGCGTGASSVALAEQGAAVTAVDTDDESLLVAAQRCEAHAVQCEFVKANGASVPVMFADRHFDFVIFFACLEHMTHGERMQAMRESWSNLRAGDLWCAIETPNRLWFYDEHTSRLPFYNWLPDDLAFEYSRFSPREPLRSAYRRQTPETMESFLRHGRAISFHEFDIAMGNAADLDVVSSLPLRLRKKGLLGWRELKRMRKPKARYERMIAAMTPDIHPGFFQPYLDLIIRKH